MAKQANTKNEMAKQANTKNAPQVIEIKAGCPTCGGSKVAKDNGTRTMPGYDFHHEKKYVGRHTKNRYVICECGQHYVIKVIEKHSGDRNVSETGD